MNIRLRSFIASALAATMIAFTAVSYADDTEIYFARANVDNDENKTIANVLIMLDTSGSMRFCENELSGGSGYNAKWCTNAAQRRINILQNALDQLLDSVSPSIRLGIGRFNYIAPDTNRNDRGTGQIGGRILVPVTDITPASKALIRSQIATLNDAGNNNSASAQNAQPVGDTPTARAYSEAARYMMGLAPLYGTSTNGAVNSVALCEGGSCSTEHIISGSQYVSPMNMNNQCETNHIILFTDGAPSDNDRPSVTDVVNNSCSAPTSGWNGQAGTPSYTCQSRIATYLNSTNNAKGREVLTHNIGLYMGSNKSNMEAVSDAGGGSTTNADNADELIAAFLNNLDLIDGQSRSISAPGIAVNTMNRFQHLDELYYAVFQPAESSYWEGNLKSYRLADQQIRGQNGNAIDPSTGYFSSDAQSYWSSEVDGADAQKGGSREQVTTRNLFYSTAGGITHKLNWSSGRNQAPTNAYFGLSTSSNPGDADRTAMFTRLQSMWGDPMHSVPLMVNYGGEQNYVFVSTNGGMLHIIDTTDGSEAAVFMPHELFEQATKFTTDRLPLRIDNTRQTYGLDASWVAWRKPGETVTDAPAAVYLYGGMRRGGKHFYALDVSTPSSPDLKWQIDAGDANFERLGQTWSTPTLTRIPTGGDTSIPALVFGGGYSPDDHDNHASRQSSDAMGNTVYIVDAESGDFIWSATHADMNWAIPGGVSVVDTDLDGVADHLYFADLGGQVFRTDLQSDGNHSVHRIAELGGNGTDHRRFYEAPAVAYVKHGAENHLYIAVASGYRAHPLDEATNEGLFVVVDKDALGTNTSSVATIANMANVANNQEMDPDTHSGWYYLFQEDIARPGEKALASPSIFDNTILLSTYAPTMDQDFDNPCAVRYGAAYLHTVNLRTGAPRSLSKDAPDPANRSEELAQTTPPPTPTIMVDEDGNTVIVVGTEVIDGGDPQNQDLRKRRWMQLPKNEALEILQPPEDEG